MSKKSEKHSFHIPVMGIGYTIDTPLKVAHYGISSVISLVDDVLIEKMRKFYCEKLDIPFQEISDKVDDFRAKRITEYLNLLDSQVKEKFKGLKDSIHEKGEEFKNYMHMLPDTSGLKKKFQEFSSGAINFDRIKELFLNELQPGAIDVNIMTKLDRENFRDDEKLPVEYNDAHAALRGFANSNVESSLVLSAGMNPRLYAYMEEFDNFYPDGQGHFKKKITLKVSDFRSAFIQGKLLAKKGIWISEYRIESGLNCGGHAFATNGNLMGPILDEFKNRRQELQESIFQMLKQALEEKGRTCPETPPQIRITAQGGVGTSDEHQFLIDHYGVDSVGWGTPFMLVPEVVNVDQETQIKLSEAKEEDLYLSNISPLGIPFNNLRGNTKDLEQFALIEKGRPGSACPKKICTINTEFTENGICSGSRQYQHMKLQELEIRGLEPAEHKREYDKIVEKSCICVGLGTAALLKNDIETKVEGPGVSVCPGPNMAYFSECVSLKSMIDHIYGRINIIRRTDKPNMFIKELQLYVDYFTKMVEESQSIMTEKKIASLKTFQKNLDEGIEYYQELFSEMKGKIKDFKSDINEQLESLQRNIWEVELVPVVS